MANTTLGQIAEIIHRSLDGSDIAPTSRFDYREVLLVVQMVYSELLTAKAKQDQQVGIEQVDGKSIISLVNQKPVLDTARNEYKVDIDQTWVTLPYNHGLFQISPMKDQNIAYIPMTNGFKALLAGTTAQCLEQQAGYYIENNTVYFVHGDKVASSLLIKIISNDEDSPCCEELQGPVMDRAQKILERRVLADNINDNTARQERQTNL